MPDIVDSELPSSPPTPTFTISLATTSPPSGASRTSSVRSSFSPPPLLSHRVSHSPGPSLSNFILAGNGNGSASPPTTRPSTAASSPFTLTPHAAHSVPGLSGSLPSLLNLTTPSDDHADEKGAPLASYLLKGDVAKPWLNRNEPRMRVSYWITVCTTFLGVAAAAAYCYHGYKNVPIITQPLCLVLQDDFDTFSVDTPGANWRREVDLSGFGNGQFEMTTTSPSNSFVRDGMLYIVPTLTADALPGGNASVFDGFLYNATGCTNVDNFQGTACGARSNASSGTVINPVQSARLTTQLSHSIQYGKVEIRAKVPRGDWLWPALWMLPVNETYGPWPLSGEIDIMEARGNDASYPGQGINFILSALNWGPTLTLNAGWRTNGAWLWERRASFADRFHTYSLEWTPEFLRIYFDTRLQAIIDLRFNEPFFERGHFPPTVQNDLLQTVTLQNPWLGRGNSAPFDQPFFLIMNVAVGGTNGWFPDNVGDKPWVDSTHTAMRDFALAQEKWYPTWPQNVEERALVVDYVKMWQLC